MMKDDESGVVQLPRPAPICWASDLAIPSLAALGASVRSTSCPTAGTTTPTTRTTVASTGTNDLRIVTPITRGPPGLPPTPAGPFARG